MIVYPKTRDSFSTDPLVLVRETLTFRNPIAR